jgi:hypothetical protein
MQDYNRIVAGDGGFLDIDNTSCSLCKKYYDAGKKERCSQCPIVKATGKTCHVAYQMRDDPRCMLRVLRKTLLYVRDINAARAARSKKSAKETR